MLKLLSLLLSLACSALLWAEDRTYELSGKEILVPGIQSQSELSPHPLWTPFIKKNFNRPGPYYGPNCYNTALNATNYYPQEKIRYTSPEEFEEILKTSFEEVSLPRYQDLVVFDALSSRSHVAFYLGDQLVFHKKSYGTYYTYRIVPLLDVGSYEENEWKPGPFEDSTSQMIWPQLGSRPTKYYRLKNSKTPLLDQTLKNYIEKLEGLLLQDLNSWSIAKKWGVMGEYFLEDLHKYSQMKKMNPYTQGVLLSLKDQVFIMLEEVNFKKARSPERVLQELCIPEKKEQLFSLIKELGLLLGRNSSSIDSALEQIEAQDKKTCDLRPLKMLLAM